MAVGFDKFTVEVRKALQLAQEEAERSGGHTIAAEHLLLGLLRQREGRHLTVLRALAVDPKTLEGAVRYLVEQRRGEPGEPGLTPEAKKAIEIAVDEVRRLQQAEIGPEHLLIGVARQGEGPAAQLLRTLGVTVEEARLQVQTGLGAAALATAGAPGPVIRSPRGGSADPWRAFVRQVDVARLDALLEELDPVTDEVAYRRCASGPGYECGVVRFLPREGERNQVTHQDKDVVCHVLRGQGRLQLGSTAREVAAGNVVRIPARTTHDFSAVDGPLVLFYVSVSVTPPEGLVREADP